MPGEDASGAPLPGQARAASTTTTGTPATRSERAGPTGRFPTILVDGALVALIVGTGFALFQPDWFDNQNGLDPFFYTGLSLNISDAIDYGAQAHYFLSRWTLYIPELLVQRVLGPSTGFVATRLVLLVVGGLGLALLRPASSRRLDLVPVAVVALFSPLVGRSVFVDYSDAVVVPLGLVMVALAAKGRIGIRTSAAIGALGACVVVANAFAIVMVAVIVAGYLARAVFQSPRFLLQLAVVAAAAAGVILAGLVFFRWRYDIANVYGPTIEFVRSNVSRRDPLKSPRLLWLQYRLWIYLPPIVLLAAAALRAARLIRLGSGELVVLGICAAQYAFHVAYQFVYDGLTLEVGYYFSYVVPAYTAGLAVVLYALFQRCSARATWMTTAAVVLAFAVWRVLPEFDLDSWVAFAAAVVAVALAAATLARRIAIVLPLGLVGIVLAAQLASPVPEPILPGELRVHPSYASLYRGGTSKGVRRFRASVRFIDRMRGLDIGVRKGAAWVIGEDPAPQLAAMYSVQVGLPNRWLNEPMGPGDPAQGAPLGQFAVDTFVSQRLTHVVVIGSATSHPAVLDQLRARGFTLGAPLLDYVDETVVPAMRVYVAPMAAANQANVPAR